MAEDWQGILERALNGDMKAFDRICGEYLHKKLLRFIIKKLNIRQADAEDILQDVFEKLMRCYEHIEERNLNSFEAFVYKLTANRCHDESKRWGKDTAYTLTTASFEAMQIEGVSQDVLAKLEPLKDDTVTGYEKFNRKLKLSLAEQNSREIRSCILRYVKKVRKTADRPPDEAFPQAARQDDDFNQQEIEAFVYTAIRNALSPDEWELLTMRTMQGATYRDIGEKLGLGAATIHARYKRILTTLQQNDTLRERWDDIKEVILS